MTATLAPPPPAGVHHPPAPPADRGRLARLVRGRPGDPTWARPALLALLALTGVLYLWDLAASGYANSFYAAAAQAGSQSWKAWFFGSLDSGNSITVDKPPAALWIDGLSARVFGFSSWSLLVPQAFEGVAAVGLLYGAVRRVSGHAAGLLAGAVLALTPAAVLMFRFDNPDALLVLLMTAGAYAIVRALEAASARWVVLAGTAIGFAFLTKMLQGLLVLPAFALVYLVAAPTSLRRRLGHVLLGGLAVVVSAGWWVAVVELWPASSRPYIGGSTDNSVLDLVFGYNGFGRPRRRHTPAPSRPSVRPRRRRAGWVVAPEDPGPRAASEGRPRAAPPRRALRRPAGCRVDRRPVRQLVRRPAACRRAAVARRAAVVRLAAGRSAAGWAAAGRAAARPAPRSSPHSRRPAAPGRRRWPATRRRRRWSWPPARP